MLATLGVPVGGPEAAKRDTKSTKIALKSDADYGMHFGSKKYRKVGADRRKN